MPCRWQHSVKTAEQCCLRASELMDRNGPTFFLSVVVRAWTTMDNNKIGTKSIQMYQNRKHVCCSIWMVSHSNPLCALRLDSPDYIRKQNGHVMSGQVLDMYRTKKIKMDSNWRRTVDITTVWSVTGFMHVKTFSFLFYIFTKRQQKQNRYVEC